MPNWCSNRLEIHCSPDTKHAIMNFAKGDMDPYFFKAVLASIQLFTAGCAGVLKPVTPVSYAPFPDLVKHGIGKVNEQNNAFSQWLNLLQANCELNKEICNLILSLYEKTGVANLSWDSFSNEQHETISALFERKRHDWFDFTWGQQPVDHQTWKELSRFPDKDHSFDMRYLIPSRLASEINGFNGGLLEGVVRTYDLYKDTYGVKWPIANNFNISAKNDSFIIVDFDTPWSPPAQEVFQRLSRIHGCRVHHYYSEEGMGFCGYAEYDKGLLMDESGDDLVYGDQDEDGYCGVIGPDYIVGNVAHYGG